MDRHAFPLPLNIPAAQTTNPLPTHQPDRTAPDAPALRSLSLLLRQAAECLTAASLPEDWDVRPDFIAELRERAAVLELHAAAHGWSPEERCPCGRFPCTARGILRLIGEVRS